MYQKILDVQPRVCTSFEMSFSRDVIRPLIVTRGADQTPLSSKFDTRSDPDTIRNYGKLLLECAASVPDGIVAFFTSYSYMQEVVRGDGSPGDFNRKNKKFVSSRQNRSHCWIPRNYSWYRRNC